eukprot:479156_1
MLSWTQFRNQISYSVYILRKLFLDDKYSFPFISNLPKILRLCHTLRRISKQLDNNHDNIPSTTVLKDFFASLITHQTSSLVVNMLDWDTPLEIMFDEKFISSLFNICYIINHENETLNELLEESYNICIQFESQLVIQTVNNCCTYIEEIPMEILCTCLSYLDPITIRKIQSVSYLFYNATQQQITNIILNGNLLFKIVLYRHDSSNVTQIGLNYK